MDVKLQLEKLKSKKMRSSNSSTLSLHKYEEVIRRVELWTQWQG